jgi:hypothetical protein
MADKAIHEMISAFATGCMDKANFVQFKDYINEGGELPDRELGELQNIISMIPVILDLETPDPAIKDMVAKKLIGMKDEIKTKIIAEKTRVTFQTRAGTFLRDKTSAIEGQPPVVPPKYKTLTFSSKNTDANNSTFSFNENKANAFTKAKTTWIDPPKMTSINRNKAAQTPIFKNEPESVTASNTVKEENESKENNSSVMTGWIAILLSILLFTILGYYVFTSVESHNRKIDALKDDVTKLRSDLSTANNFIGTNSSLIEFMNYKDIQQVDLKPLNVNDKATARLLLSFGEKEGLIQFKDAKPLAPNQGYQVWANSKGQSYSIGTYQPNGSEYLKITSFPFIPKEKIESFRVTISPNNGLQTPPAASYLIGSFSGKVK